MAEKDGEEAAAVVIDERKVDIAARFLSNSNVMETEKENQELFLKNKGLNANEIELAFQRATEIKENEPIACSSWSIFDYLKGIVLGAGILSAANYAYKAYVLPYATRELKDDARMEILVESFQDVKDDIKQHTYELTGTLKQMQALMEENQKSLISINNALNKETTDCSSTAELKSELSLIKSMMLSKDQFRPTPYTAIKQKVNEIPAWQQIADEFAADKETEESSKQDPTEISETEVSTNVDSKDSSDADLSYVSAAAEEAVATVTTELNGVLYEVVPNSEPNVENISQKEITNDTVILKSGDTP